MAWTTISVTLSLLISLSLTRLLTGLVAIFRARKRASLDWIPVVWAVLFIVALLQMWVALNDLAHRLPAFTFVEYLSLGGMLMLLFAASSLLLPPGEMVTGDSLESYFADEGRFALPMFSVFLLCGAIANIVLFGNSPMSIWFALDVPMILLPLTAFFARSRPSLAAITALYCPLFAVDVWVSLTY